MEDNVEKYKPKLAAAVENCDIALLKDELERGADVNCKNKDGDTLLHIAIANNVGHDCLQFLLENGACSNATNKMGLKPLDAIDPESSGTFLDLLQLEKYFDAKDYRGNTILHFLMVYAKDALQVIKSARKIDFNVQNLHGQTPVHLAVKHYPYEDEILEYILSNFDDVNLLLQDSRGDTVLHSYLKDFGGNSEIVRNILRGTYKCCSGARLEQLLGITNQHMKTPFLLHIDKDGLGEDIEICKEFLQAGANINAFDIKGETALNVNLFLFDKEQLPVVEFLARNGVNVNKQNIFLETSLFCTNSEPIIQELLNNGADVNIQNKVGKSVLMAKLLESDEDGDVLHMLVDNGADVNAVDIHGNTCLHYAAWSNLCENLVQFLKENGAKITQNNAGEFPCFVAESRLHVSIIDELCICSPDTHNKEVSFTEAEINAEELCGEVKASTVNAEIGRVGVSKLLGLPHVGSVEFSGEADELRQAVIKVVADICQAIGEIDELLKNTVLQSGSVGEKTKIGLPDEFDFICLIDFVSQTCELDETMSKENAGYAYVTLKEEHRNKHYREVFDDNCYLNSALIFDRFEIALRDVIKTPNFYKHPNIVFGLEDSNERTCAPNCKFSLRWTGAMLKDVLIDVDLVPACRIPYWWPSETNLDPLAADKETVQSEGALIILQATVDENFIPMPKLRVSAQGAEAAQMKVLPRVARDAYMVSKLLCSEKICPHIVLSKDPENPIYLQKYVTSYMLKNCTFHVYHEEPMAENVQAPDKVESMLHEFVVRIFKKLISFAESETLPAFVFPWQNIFTFQETVGGTVSANALKQKCMCRIAYGKLILNMLGVDVDFTDWDIEAVDGPFF